MDAHLYLRKETAGLSWMLISTSEKKQQGYHVYSSLPQNRNSRVIMDAHLYLRIETAGLSWMIISTLE